MGHSTWKVIEAQTADVRDKNGAVSLMCAQTTCWIFIACSRLSPRRANIVTPIFTAGCDRSWCVGALYHYPGVCPVHLLLGQLTSLCTSDSFSRIGGDKGSSADVEALYGRLMEEVIPRFAAALDAGDLELKEGVTLSARLHQYGINLYTRTVHARRCLISVTQSLSRPFVTICQIARWQANDPVRGNCSDSQRNAEKSVASANARTEQRTRRVPPVCFSNFGVEGWHVS